MLRDFGLLNSSCFIFVGDYLILGIGGNKRMSQRRPQQQQEQQQPQQPLRATRKWCASCAKRGSRCDGLRPRFRCATKSCSVNTLYVVQRLIALGYTRLHINQATSKSYRESLVRKHKRTRMETHATWPWPNIWAYTVRFDALFCTYNNILHLLACRDIHTWTGRVVLAVSEAGPGMGWQHNC